MQARLGGLSGVESQSLPRRQGRYDGVMPAVPQQRQE